MALDANKQRRDLMAAEGFERSAYRGDAKTAASMAAKGYADEARDDALAAAYELGAADMARAILARDHGEGEAPAEPDKLEGLDPLRTVLDIVAASRRTAPSVLALEGEGEAAAYAGAEERTCDVKVNYCGEQGVEGMWARVTPHQKERIMEDTNAGELMRAVMDNDALDGRLPHGAEVIIETRGKLRPLVLGYISKAAAAELWENGWE